MSTWVRVARPMELRETLMSDRVGSLAISRRVSHTNDPVRPKSTSSNDAVNTKSGVTPKVESSKSPSGSHTASREAISYRSAESTDPNTVEVYSNSSTVTAPDRPPSGNHVWIRPNNGNGDNSVAPTEDSGYVDSPIDKIPPYTPFFRPPAGPLIRFC